MGKLIIKSIKHGDKTVLFDDCDAHLINNHSWSLHVNGKNIQYARTSRTVGKGKRQWFFMHNLITNTIASNSYIDHSNGDGLDNRRLNLRQCTHVQNMHNQRIPKNNTTGFKGVSKIGKGYKATISVNMKRLHIGCFNNLIDAAKAYNDAAIKYFGEFARLNYTEQETARTL